MESLFYNISQVLGITIIHSLWQGLLIYSVLRLVLLVSGQLPASKKYSLCLISLLAITGWFIYTAVNEIHIYNWLAVKPGSMAALVPVPGLPAGMQQLDDKTIRYYYNIAEYLPYITIIYLIGLLFNLTRLLLARKKINTIRQTMSLDVALQQQVHKFALLLNISTNVKLGLSSLVNVPCMIGYFKPVILLPFTLSSYLSAHEIEAILLHELAHIKRNDYLVNLLQQAIGILLFFNPCAQLINRLINEERENCCDDLVVSTTSNPLIYAKALLKLEQTNQKNLQLAMPATGKKYYLLTRIERIMKIKQQNQSFRPALLAVVILTLGIGSIALFNPQIAQGKISVKAPIHAVISQLLADTTPKSAKKTTHYKRAYKSNTDARYNSNRNNNNNNNYNYAYNSEDRWDFHDAELERLSKEVEKYGEAIGKYYESSNYKSQTEALERKGREMEAFYNKPELKRLQEEMEKAGEDFQKNYGETAETTDLSRKMEALGKKIETYYNSAEFKKINEALEKKYGVSHRRYNYGRNRKNGVTGTAADAKEEENYDKYQAELKTYIPAEVNQESEELKQLGEKMRDHFQSPEYRRQSERLKVLGDSLRNAFRNPGIEHQKIEMQALSRKVREYSQNPEIKKQQELLKQATAKMRAYMNTPDFKRRLAEYKKERRARGLDRDDDESEKSAPDTTKTN